MVGLWLLRHRQAQALVDRGALLGRLPPLLFPLVAGRYFPKISSRSTLVCCRFLKSEQRYCFLIPLTLLIAPLMVVLSE